MNNLEKLWEKNSYKNTLNKEESKSYNRKAAHLLRKWINK